MTVLLLQASQWCQSLESSSSMLSPTDGCADQHGLIAKKIAQVLQPTTVFHGTVEVRKRRH